MSSSQLFLKQDDNQKRGNYLVREFLKERNEVSVVSNFKGAFLVTRVCNYLAMNNFAEIADIKTYTEVFEDKRRIKFEILLKKSKDFDKVYAENEERKKKLIEEREKQKTAQA